MTVTLRTVTLRTVTLRTVTLRTVTLRNGTQNSVGSPRNGQFMKPVETSIKRRSSGALKIMISLKVIRIPESLLIKNF